MFQFNPFFYTQLKCHLSQVTFFDQQLRINISFSYWNKKTHFNSAIMYIELGSRSDYFQ